jgi:RimJ/RimL family protein N-acetyltransferase
MNSPQLTGQKITLGPLSNIPYEKTLAWRNDYRIFKWSRQREPLEKSNHVKWCEGLSSRADLKMFGIFEGETPVGVCGLSNIDLINRSSEFSIYIGPSFWGQGLAQDALKTLVKYGFHVLGLNHIFGETFDGNQAAKCFEKVGFKKEGTRRAFYFREGKFIDAHLYSILASEF